MRLAVIIPDRGDRPKLFENCWRMMGDQTLKPVHFEVVDYAPESKKVDITQRYRRGYEALKGKGFDLIALIENDDWYSPEYFETMVGLWESYGKPELFGTIKTIYYHIKLKKYYIMEHHNRSSAMNTFIKPDLDFPWCVDEEPYTDLHLWKTVVPRRVVIDPPKILSIGIKHNTGLCGGDNSHNVDDPRIARRYHFEDNGFLKETMDAESFEFYNNYFKQ